MNITRENKGDLTLQLKIEILANDYQDAVKKTLNDYQRKANMPGFRPGKVPFGLINKMYGKAVLGEEVNKLLSDTLQKYIEDNKFETLGQPIPMEDKEKVDFETQTDFTFWFEVGLAPEFTVDLSKVKAKAYQITVSDDMVQKSVDSLLERFKDGDKPAELNQELFDKVYGKDVVKSEKELREKIRQEGEKVYQREADRKFTQDAIEAVIEDTKMTMPDEFLKRWLFVTNQDKDTNITMEQVEADYDRYRNMLKWQLIESNLLKEHDVKVSRDDVKNYYIDNVISQYFPIPEDEEGRKRLEQFAESMMQNQEEVKQVYDMIYDQKVSEILRSSMSVTNKKIDFDDFVELLKKEHEKDQKDEEKAEAKEKKKVEKEEKTEKKTARKTVKKEESQAELFEGGEEPEKKTRKPRKKKEDNE